MTPIFFQEGGGGARETGREEQPPSDPFEQVIVFVSFELTLFFYFSFCERWNPKVFSRDVSQGLKCMRIA